jgi:hypothetical protein
MIVGAKHLGLLFASIVSGCSLVANADSRMRACWGAAASGGAYNVNDFQGVIIGPNTLVIASERCPGFRMEAVEFSTAGRAAFERAVAVDQLGVRGVSGFVSVTPIKVIDDRVLEVKITVFRPTSWLSEEKTDQLIGSIRQIPK